MAWVGRIGMSHTCEALSPYTRPRGEFGPTQTQEAQKQFAQRLRGVLARINARIREFVGEKDLFNLQTEALEVDDPEEVFDFPTSQAKITGFLQWLREQLDTEFLEVVGPDRNQFILKAYFAGLRNVHRQLGDLGVSFRRPDVDELVGAPIHRSALQELYTRTYENLVSVRDDVAQAVRDELVEGFRDGKGPREIARNLTDRVDSIGKHRSTMIARSEVMNAHSESTLNRVDELNKQADNEISVGHGEWDADMDSPRTCAFCRAINSTRLRVSEMRGTTVQFRGDVYRLKPPAHPNGRCNIRIMVGGTIEEPLADRLPEEVTLLT